MTRMIDGFLFHNEIGLLEIRLEYLSDVIDRFVIVTSSQTFTGRPTQPVLLEENATVIKFRDRIDLVHLNTLVGAGPWERETYSRNAIARELANCRPDDLVVISDIDELPRKSVLRAIRAGEFGGGPLVLGLDYFNFKFNYKMIHGRQAVWAGPVVSRYRDLISPQEARSKRWTMLEVEGQGIEDAGWHFSFLTSTDDLSPKLDSFSHQEAEVQRRGSSGVDSLIERREGFHDHLHAGSVWAVASLDSLGCPELAALLKAYPRFLASAPFDSDDVLRRRIRRSVSKIHHEERKKILSNCSSREIAAELVHRFKRKLV